MEAPEPPVAFLASSITLLAVFVLAVAVQHRLVESDPDFPIPATVHTRLSRVEMIVRPAVLIAAGIGTAVCLYVLRVRKGAAQDLDAVATMVFVLYFVLFAHTLVRTVLPRLWRAPRRPHLAPRLRGEEVRWATATVSLGLLILLSLPQLIYARQPAPGLIAFLLGAALVLAVHHALTRRSQRSTARQREERDKARKSAGLVCESRVLKIDGCDIDIQLFREPCRGQVFLDLDRARELAADVACTRMAG